MLGFYAVRGYTPYVLANLTKTEKMFLHYAREEYYREMALQHEALFGARS